MRGAALSCLNHVVADRKTGEHKENKTTNRHTNSTIWNCKGDTVAQKARALKYQHPVGETTPQVDIPGQCWGFGMTPWCVVHVCSWRRPLADRHSLPFPRTLSLHRRWCPSASHPPVSFLFLHALTYPLYFPFLSLDLSLHRPWCPSQTPGHSTFLSSTHHSA